MKKYDNFATTANSPPILPAEVRSFRAAFYVLAFVMLSEVGCLVLTDSDVVRAAIICGIIIIIISFKVSYSLVSCSIVISGIVNQSIKLFLPSVVASLYGIGIALLQGNAPYYLLADIYHFVAEMLLITILTLLFFQFDVKTGISRLIIILLALGIMGLTSSIFGLLGLSAAGGHYVESIGFWRMKAGRGFPEIPVFTSN